MTPTLVTSTSEISSRPGIYSGKTWWQEFRFLSGETRRIASCCASLIDCNTSPSEKSHLRLLDVGCGDGSFFIEAVSRSRVLKRGLESSLLVDKSQLMMDEARRTTSAFPPIGSKVSFLNVTVEECLPAIHSLGPFDVLVLSHVVYYLEPDTVAKLLEFVARDGVVVVVIDSPDSLFAEFWDLTAPHFSSRIRAFHARYARFCLSQIILKIKMDNPAVVAIAAFLESTLEYGRLAPKESDVSELVLSHSRRDVLDIPVNVFALTNGEWL